MSLPAGTKLGRFVLESQLGKGAAGVVYLATDTRLNEKVALKVLHEHLAEDHEVVERFQREIVLTRRITHPGVCRLHDLHEEDGLIFVTMEYVEGQTLAALIHKEARLSPQRTLEVLRGLAAPIDAAHEAGVVHRDLKPGNILVRKDGSICVLDFGMATAEDVTKITRAGRTVGSLRFIAPEVWEGKPATPASDRYAIGVVLYACLAGRLPYEASSPEEAFRAQKQELPSLTDHNTMVSPALHRVVKKAMARDPDARWESLAAMTEAFEVAVGADLRPSSPSGTSLVRPRDPSQVDQATVAVTPVRLDDDTATPAPPAAAPVAVPPTALIAAGVVAVIVLAAVVAAVLTSPDDAPRAAAAPAAPADPSAPDAPEAPPDDAPDDAPDDDADAPDDDADALDGAIDGALDGAEEAPGDVRAAPSVRKASASASARTAAVAAMKRRGLIRGDVPAIDAELSRVRSLERAGRDASTAWDRVRSLANKETIDRGFITSKQKRLHFAAERAHPSVIGKISALEREVEKHVVAREYTAANQKLNRAFMLLR